MNFKVLSALLGLSISLDLKSKVEIETAVSTAAATEVTFGTAQRFLNDQAFDNALSTSNMPWMVNFCFESCPHCQHIAPIFTEFVADNYGNRV